MAPPFRELRHHLAVIHRLLNRARPRRNTNHDPIATRLNESLCTLARAARTAGLSTYCSLTLHILEQLSASTRTCYVPIDARDLVLQWVKLSWLYFLAPMNPLHARELVTHMGDRRWERSVCQTHQDTLLESLRGETLALAMLHQTRRSPRPRR